jgi:RimJ/RimL family protein N-acetyltransferase
MPDIPAPDRPIRGLRGRLVYLRPLEPSDAALVHRWYEDVRIAEIMGDLPVSLARRERRYADAAAAREDDVFRFAICLLADDEMVGRVDLFDIDKVNGSCMFGITIGDPARWGHGLGTDALNALTDFAFGQLRIERVQLDTDRTNLRAQAAYRKAGFVAEAVQRRSWWQNGAWQDDVRMALIRDDWRALDRPRSWDLVAEAIAEAESRET